MITKQKLVLGSGSPRRKLILKEMGIVFRVVTGSLDETPLPHLRSQEIAVYLAEEKSKALSDKIQENEILVTADTIVWLDGSMLGKPNDKDDAFRMISRLSGKKHFVYTGICLVNSQKSKTFSVTSTVVFNSLTPEDIINYIEIYQPYDKAGAYGAQECIEEGKNPCSPEEMQFLERINQPDLYRRTFVTERQKTIPLIKYIEGSYFNVMGLPIVELFDELKMFDEKY